MRSIHAQKWILVHMGCRNLSGGLDTKSIKPSAGNEANAVWTALHPTEMCMAIISSARRHAHTAPTTIVRGTPHLLKRHTARGWSVGRSLGRGMRGARRRRWRLRVASPIHGAGRRRRRWRRRRIWRRWPRQRWIALRPHGSTVIE